MPCGSRNWLAQAGACLLLTVALFEAGCRTYRNAIPADRYSGPQASRSDKRPIDFSCLRQNPPPAYILGPRDILGVYIEGVLGKVDDAPPVFFPKEGDSQPPALGYPVPVGEDGTVPLPLVPPIRLAGLTLPQAQEELRMAYVVRNQILQPGADRIIVSLMKPRTYSVMVVREDTANDPRQFRSRQVGEMPEPERKGMTKAVELRAYENDVLHALAATGGLPGTETKNEIRIVRGAIRKPGDRDRYLTTLDSMTGRSDLVQGRQVITIPLRISPNDPPVLLNPDEVILEDGDIVFIESRDAEVFYTGGLLNGGQYPLPRDYDLDVLGAIAMSGGSVAAVAGGSGSVHGNGSNGAIFPPTRVLILRNQNGNQIAIELSLKTAIANPRQRILVRPNDFIILEYTPAETWGNVVLNNLNVSLSLNSLFGNN
jgi:protein involved in polysaccharide export with SLBB domain